MSSTRKSTRRRKLKHYPAAPNASASACLLEEEELGVGHSGAPGANSNTMLIRTLVFGVAMLQSTILIYKFVLILEDAERVEESTAIVPGEIEELVL